MGGGDSRAGLESKNVLFVPSQRQSQNSQGRVRRRSYEVIKGQAVANSTSHMIPHLVTSSNQQEPTQEAHLMLTHIKGYACERTSYLASSWRPWRASPPPRGWVYPERRRPPAR